MLACYPSKMTERARWAWGAISYAIMKRSFRQLWDEHGTLYSPWYEEQMALDIRAEMQEEMGFIPTPEVTLPLSTLAPWEPPPGPFEPPPKREEIGEELGICGERVRQIERQALAKLRKRCKKLDLEP